MRNFTVILIFFVTVFFSCKSGSGSNNDKEDSNNIVVADVGNLNSSTGLRWTKKYRNQFLVGCIEKAVETISSAEAEKYCDCMVDKVQQKYPDESEVNARLTQNEIENMRGNCLETNKGKVTTGWSLADKQEFLNSCSSKMKGSLGVSKAKEYCDCMINKIVRQSPEVNSTQNITQSQLAVWGSDCLK